MYVKQSNSREINRAITGEEAATLKAGGRGVSSYDDLVVHIHGVELIPALEVKDDDV